MMRWLLSIGLLLLTAEQCAFGGEVGSSAPVSPWSILPFIILLLAIAVVPLIDRSWWERYYPAVCVSLGVVTIGYYLFVLRNTEQLLHTGMEYISFIVLIGSLFVVSGGIHIRIKGKSKPLANTFLLAIGAVVSNVLGTTGASMILLRPYLRMNRYRIQPYHVVFFIFVVSNMGGALTPIGDPPLFLGYLRGIPFFWVAEHLWLKWLVGMVAVLGVFYVIDLINFGRLSASVRHGAEGAEAEGEVSGLQNVFFLAVILAAVFISDPPLVREVLMVLAAGGSYLTTHHELHRKNDFNFHPIMEVAILFLGIFATMMPALNWLQANAASIGIHSPGQFYWSTGSLSAFLDNAPTYLSLLTAGFGLLVPPEAVAQLQDIIREHGTDLSSTFALQGEGIRNTMGILLRYHYDLVASGNVPQDIIMSSYLLGNHQAYVQAISLGAVFFGACTYIANGPNFMVKSIAEHSGVPCPSFFGYVFRYTLPVLIPIFTLIWVLFFHAE